MDFNIIDKLKNKDGFQEIDLQFAKFILKLSNTEDVILYLSAALASYNLRNGNICCELNQLSKSIFPIYKSGIELNSNKLPTIELPDINTWLNCLSKYPKIISKDSYTPFILDSSNRFYLHRYWNYENKLAGNLSSRCKTDFSILSKLSGNQISSVSKYFSDYKSSETDWQQIAVFTALVNNFTIITGGPGTGKTSTVAAVIAILLDLSPNYKIKICAPTGKAGSRLIESIHDELENLNPENSLLTIESLKKLEAFTVHRLLGSLPLSPHFKHNSKNKILADVVIIDEASMIPLTLFAKLFDAISHKTKIILLGDKDQLASVEAGAVMSNLCQAFKPNSFSSDFTKAVKKYFKNNNWNLREEDTKVHSSSLEKKNIESSSAHLEDNIVLGKENEFFTNITIELKKSYRFDDKKGIGLFKKAINNSFPNILSIGKNISDEFILKNTPRHNEFEYKLVDFVENVFLSRKNTISEKIKLTDYLNAESPEEAFSILNEFKILCSHNSGQFGVKNINRIIHNIFFNEPFELLPVGTPIMIQSNNPQLNLYNGDIGIIWLNNDGNKKAFFPDIKSNFMKPYSISILPDYIEVFAMTIHKSQGSGFQNILIILPDKLSPILTKELLYTAVTRAKSNCVLWANDDILLECVRRETIRSSGLYDKLLLYN